MFTLTTRRGRVNKNAYKLFHNGVRALADVERNGIRIDIPYVKKEQKKAWEKIEQLKHKIKATEEGKCWQKKYGEKFNIDSNVQLANVLFKELGIEPPRVTEKGNPSVDKNTLHLIKAPIIKPLTELRKLNKLSGTYLKGIIEETVNGYLHPSFNLHLVSTFRSSSSNPNFQNIPTRDPVVGKIIRSAFIPREGGWIGGLDYSGIELSMAGCNSKDPMIIKNFTTIHKTAAADCFMLEEDEVTKDARYCGKNMFVFPQLYGSWYEQCGPNMWNGIREMKLKTKSGTGLYKHLKEDRITNEKRFVQHIKGVEREFWKTYLVHKMWQEGWMKDYDKKGYIEMLTGFKCGDVLSKNQLLNYANQGPAFHCLLWSLIEMNKWLKKYKMKSKIIGQIHDDMVMDIDDKEKDDVLKQASYIMCEKIKKAWEWIITPLEVSASFSNVNWYSVEDIKI